MLDSSRAKRSDDISIKADIGAIGD